MRPGHDCRGDVIRRLACLQPWGRVHPVFLSLTGRLTVDAATPVGATSVALHALIASKPLSDVRGRLKSPLLSLHSPSEPLVNPCSFTHRVIQQVALKILPASGLSR